MSGTDDLEEVARCVEATGGIVRDLADKRAKMNLRMHVIPPRNPDQKYMDLAITYTDPATNVETRVERPQFMIGEASAHEALRFFRSDKLRDGSRREKHGITLYGNDAVNRDYRALYDCLIDAYVEAWPRMMTEDTSEALAQFGNMMQLDLTDADTDTQLQRIADRGLSTKEHDGKTVTDKWDRFMLGRIRIAFPYAQAESQTAFVKRYTNERVGETRMGLNVTLREPAAPKKTAARPAKVARNANSADVAADDTAVVAPNFDGLSLTRVTADGARVAVPDVAGALCSHLQPAIVGAAEEEEARQRAERRPIHAHFAVVEMAQVFVLERNVYPLKYLRWACLASPTGAGGGRPIRSRLSNLYPLGSYTGTMTDALDVMAASDASLIIDSYAEARREGRFKMRVDASRMNNGYHTVCCERRTNDGRWITQNTPHYALHDDDDGTGFLAFRASKYAPNSNDGADNTDTANANSKFAMQIFGDSDMEMELRALYDTFIDALCLAWPTIKAGHFKRELKLFGDLNLDPSAVGNMTTEGLMHELASKKLLDRWNSHLRGCVTSGFPFNKDRSACFVKAIPDRDDPTLRRYGLHVTVPELPSSGKDLAPVRLQDVSCTVLTTGGAGSCVNVDPDDVVQRVCRVSADRSEADRSVERLSVRAAVFVFDTVYCANDHDLKVFPRRNLRWLCLDDTPSGGKAGRVNYASLVN